VFPRFSGSCQEIAADIFECCPAISTSFKTESKVLSFVSFLLCGPTKISSFIFASSGVIYTADIKNRFILHSFGKFFY
jgi:hypothetical protein